MGKRAQIKSSQKNAGNFVPIARTVPGKALSAQKWRKDLLMSWLFQTCIRLQTSLDRRFLRLGMSGQGASVLLRCVEARRITLGQLAVGLGRDKGQTSRYIDRLDSSGLLVRETRQRDGRLSIIKPTAKGKRAAQELALVFDKIRKELFAGIVEDDIRRVSQILRRLHNNAVRIGARRRKSRLRERRRIGSHSVKSPSKEISQSQVPPDSSTNSSNGPAVNTAAVEFA